MNTEPISQHYAIQVRIPAKNSLSGEAYWDALRLENGKLQTDNLEYANGSLAVAQQNFPANEVHLVLIQTSVICY